MLTHEGELAVYAELSARVIVVNESGGSDLPQSASVSSRMLHIGMSAVTIAIGLGAIWLLLLSGSEVVARPPDNAIVFIDRNSGVYYAPDCPPAEAYEDQDLMSVFRELRAELGGQRVWETLSERNRGIEKAKYGMAKQSYVAEQNCKEKGAFWESYSWPISVLKNWGLWPGPKSRWNEDGTWNWDSSLW